MFTAEIDKMMVAYKQLFQIENRLRNIVKTNLKKDYGPNWTIRLNENHSVHNAHYPDLVAFFGKYPQSLPHFTDSQRKQLRLLIPIRNKIAHSHWLNENEYELMLECNDLVMSQPIT